MAEHDAHCNASRSAPRTPGRNGCSCASEFGGIGAQLRAARDLTVSEWAEQQRVWQQRRLDRRQADAEEARWRSAHNYGVRPEVSVGYGSLADDMAAIDYRRMTGGPSATELAVRYRTPEFRMPTFVDGDTGLPLDDALVPTATYTTNTTNGLWPFTQPIIEMRPSEESAATRMLIMGNFDLVMRKVQDEIAKAFGVVLESTILEGYDALGIGGKWFGKRISAPLGRGEGVEAASWVATVWEEHGCEWNIAQEWEGVEYGRA